jgi:hypothetical protein
MFELLGLVRQHSHAVSPTDAWGDRARITRWLCNPTVAGRRHPNPAFLKEAMDNAMLPR